MSEPMIKTVQTIEYLKYGFPDLKVEEDRAKDAEHKVIEAFNKMYRNQGIVLKSHENKYLEFTIYTSTYDGECRTKDLESSYLFFIGVCAGLGLVQRGL